MGVPARILSQPSIPLTEMAGPGRLGAAAHTLGMLLGRSLERGHRVNDQKTLCHGEREDWEGLGQPVLLWI